MVATASVDTSASVTSTPNFIAVFTGNADVSSSASLNAKILGEDWTIVTVGSETFSTIAVGSETFTNQSVGKEVFRKQ